MGTQISRPDTKIGRLLNAMVNRVRWVALILIVVSAVLTLGGISSTPDKEVSFSPGGEVFDTGEIVVRTFRASTTEFVFLVEDQGEDALDAETLREWKANSDALRSSEELSGELSQYFNDDLGLTITGTYSIADAVDVELRRGDVPEGLQAASDDQVKQALSNLLSEDRPTAGFRDDFSKHAEVSTTTVGSREIEFWVSPAFITTVRVDHSAFPVDAEKESDPATRTARHTWWALPVSGAPWYWLSPHPASPLVQTRPPEFPASFNSASALPSR